MAEAAQTQLSAPLALPGPEIKQETSGLDTLNFTLPTEMDLKRALESCGDLSVEPEPKRVKTEDGTENDHQGRTEEESLEDGLALLVQNALSGVEDLVGHFSDAPQEMDHDHMGEKSDEPPAPPVEEILPPVIYLSEPEKYVKHAAINALGNLSLSLLLIFCQQPTDETLRLLRQTDSEHACSLQKLRGSFEALRQLYANGPVLTAADLDLATADARAVLEFANLATLGSWLIDGGTASFSKAEAYLLQILASQISDSPPGLTELYFDARIRHVVEAILADGQDKDAQIQLAETLDQGLEEKLCEVLGVTDLPEPHQNFVCAVSFRKVALVEEVRGESDMSTFRQKYPADDLLRSYVSYIRGRILSAEHVAPKFGVSIPSDFGHVDPIDPLPDFDAADHDEMDLDDLSSFFERTTSGLVQNALAGLAEEEQSSTPTIQIDEAPSEPPAPVEEQRPAEPVVQPHGMPDYKELEALVAESTSNYVKTTLHGLSPVPYQPTVPMSTAESMAAQSAFQTHLQQQQQQQQQQQPQQQTQNQHPYYSYTQTLPEQPAQPAASGEKLPPNQTFPSSILYDRARQAALTKSTAHTRREGNHSTRRPWTQEEEKALMHGLDLVQGPHWSQILTYFGRNGTISDILKERTQVQLKDKARNLKLFFLKANTEMPFYLNTVTGELKTRAPTQAARKEAEERARLNSEEDKAKLQGIMTLAGMQQHPSQQRATGSPATMVGTGVVTPAQAASASHAALSAQNPATAHNAQHAQSNGTLALPTVTPTNASQSPIPGSLAKTAQAMSSVPHAPPRPQGQPYSQPPLGTQAATATHPAPVNTGFSAINPPTQATSAAGGVYDSANRSASTPAGQQPGQGYHTPGQQSQHVSPAASQQPSSLVQTNGTSGQSHTHDPHQAQAEAGAHGHDAVNAGQAQSHDHLMAHATSTSHPQTSSKSPIFDDEMEAALLKGLQAAVAAEMP